MNHATLIGVSLLGMAFSGPSAAYQVDFIRDHVDGWYCLGIPTSKFMPRVFIQRGHAVSIRTLLLEFVHQSACVMHIDTAMCIIIFRLYPPSIEPTLYQHIDG